MAKKKMTARNDRKGQREKDCDEWKDFLYTVRIEKICLKLATLDYLSDHSSVIFSMEVCIYILLESKYLLG